MPLSLSKKFQEEGLVSKSWVFKEAQDLLKSINKNKKDKKEIIFETGFGPSGLPHIGTFCEVLRTTMVVNALKVIEPGVKTKLLVFSDDMDGLRKVPTNLPKQDMLEENLHRSLSSIPDPFETDESFSAHNNKRLCNFLDNFGFEYEFCSSTKFYKGGLFNQMLLKVMEKYHEIVDLIAPTLGEERRATYSPFMPVCPRTGKVLQVQILERSKDTVKYKDPETHELVEVCILDGGVKLQWKVDWGMRWSALDVDYEMCGKDLRDSFALSRSIAHILGCNSPIGLIYEMFLDKNGEKISKSKGNGLSIEEWLSYAPKESLAFYMYQNPKSARKLSFDVIPRAVDDYLQHIKTYETQEVKTKLGNPVWHIHGGDVPVGNTLDLSFGILLNVASTCNTQDQEVMWGFIDNYSKNSAESLRDNLLLQDMVRGALNYYKDFVVPNKKYRLGNEQEIEAMKELLACLEGLDTDTKEEDIQFHFYEVGKKLGLDLRGWFQSLYEILMGQNQGPRWGIFAKLYGLENMRQLIRDGIDGKLVQDK